jgi:hypothetical protein
MGLLVTNLSRSGWRSHVLGIWGFPPKCKVTTVSREANASTDSSTALCSLFSDVSNSDYVQKREKKVGLILHLVSLLLTFQWHCSLNFNWYPEWTSFKFLVPKTQSLPHSAPKPAAHTDLKVCEVHWVLHCIVGYWTKSCFLNLYFIWVVWYKHHVIHNTSFNKPPTTHTNVIILFQVSYQGLTTERPNTLHHLLCTLASMCGSHAC